MQFIRKYTPDGDNLLVSLEVAAEFKDALITSGLLAKCNAVVPKAIEEIVRLQFGQPLTMDFCNSVFAVIFAQLRN